MSITDMSDVATSPQNKTYVELADFVIDKLTIPSPRINITPDNTMRLEWISTKNMVTVYIAEDGELSWLSHFPDNYHVGGHNMDDELLRHLRVFQGEKTQ